MPVKDGFQTTIEILNIFKDKKIAPPPIIGIAFLLLF